MNADELTPPDSTSPAPPAGQPRRSSRWKLWAAGGGVLLAATAGAIFFSQQARERDPKWEPVVSQGEKMVAALREVRSNSPTPVYEGPPPEVLAGADDTTKLAAWMERSGRRAVATQAAYQQAAVRVRLGEVLGTEWILSDDKRVALQERLLEFEPAIDRVEEAMSENFLLVQEDLRAMKMSPQFEAEVLGGFQRSHRDSWALTKKWLEIEHALVDCAQEMADLVAASDPPASVERGAVVFASAAARKRYADLTWHFRELAMQESEILRQQASALDAKVDKLNEVTKR